MKQTSSLNHEMRPLSAAVIASLAATGADFSSAQAADANRTSQSAPSASANTAEEHPYVGMWVTDDGRVRHKLLSNGRYDEARGSRERAYQGRYEVQGNYIEYWDDTGFTADGDFVDVDTLHHGGMILRRRR